MTDLHETILSVLQDEALDPDDIIAIMAMVDAAEFRKLEDERLNPPEPCTMAAQMLGCTCRMSHTHSASIDPPEPIRARDCPVHGSPAPEYEHEGWSEAREEWRPNTIARACAALPPLDWVVGHRDDPPSRGGRGTPFVYDRNPETTMVDLDDIPDEGCD